MNWNNWTEFAVMGGYGLYVWGSVAMCAAAMLAEVLQVRQRARALQARARLETELEHETQT